MVHSSVERVLQARQAAQEARDLHHRRHRAYALSIRRALEEGVPATELATALKRHVSASTQSPGTSRARHRVLVRYGLLSPWRRRQRRALTVARRNSSGRKLFSLRKVQGWRTSPASWASRTRLVGSRRRLELSRGRSGLWSARF